MICADTSVLIPAIGEWHVRHRLANEALTGTIIAVGHCIIEAYAVLTRMPEPFRDGAGHCGCDADGARR